MLRQSRTGEGNVLRLDTDVSPKGLLGFGGINGRQKSGPPANNDQTEQNPEHAHFLASQI